MPNWTKTLPDTAAALGLKKTGSEWKGPCPVCGGNDRFWLSKGRTHDILASCRHGCTFGEIAKELKNLGLLLPDDDYQRPKYSEIDLHTADFMILAIEGAMNSGELINGEDRRAIKRLMGLVDPARKAKLGQLLERLRFADL